MGRDDMLEVRSAKRRVRNNLIFLFFAIRKSGTMDPKLLQTVVKSSKIVGSARNAKDTDPPKTKKIDLRVSTWKNVF